MTTRRQQQAEETRLTILRAARTSFAEHGYAATTIAGVARAAGVSPQTIYDSVGSKAALVAGMNDLIDADSVIGELIGEIPTCRSAERLVEIGVAIPRSIYETSGDIVRISLAARYTDPDLAVILDEGTRRHRGGIAVIVGRIEAIGGLRPDLDLETACDSFAVLTDVSVWLHLEDQYGFSLAQTVAWASRSASDLLLGP